MRCGYPASAIRERIYAEPGPDGERFGLLLYTGTPDAEGTLGGLVRQARHFEDHLADALHTGVLCSNDPLCAWRAPVLVVSLAREPFVAPADLERREGRDEHVGGRLGGPDARWVGAGTWLWMRTSPMPARSRRRRRPVIVVFQRDPGATASGRSPAPR